MEYNTKYSKEFKLACVLRYLNEEYLETPPNTENHSFTNNVGEWVRLYKLHGEQMTCNSLRLFFKHIKKELDIKVLSPHKLRHFYATNIYNKSLDIYLTCQLLGHSDIKMTQIYLDIDEKDNQNKHKIYNPLNYLTY